MSLKSFPKLEAFCRNRREKRPIQKARVDYDFLVRLHGIVKWNEKKGSWRGISKAERQLKRSRMSIYDTLALNPILRKKPKKIYPEYKDFWENPDIQKYQKMQTLQVRSLTTVNRRLGHLQEYWLALNRTNPMNWDLDDYISLLQNLKFHDPNSILAQATPTKIVMGYQHLDSLRAWIMYSQPELFMENKSIFTTKGHKRRSGKKLTWFLTPEEQAKLLEVIDDLTFLTYCILQLRTGSRFSGMMQIRANDVNFVARTVRVFETKTMKPWNKPIDALCSRFLNEYMTTYKITGNQKIFPYTNVNQVNYKLQRYALKCGITEFNPKWLEWKKKHGKAPPKKEEITKFTKPISSHILRHTFALMCSINGISLEKTAKIGGWDDPKTLMDFYFHIPPKELRDAYDSIDWTKPIPKEVIVFKEKIVEGDEKEE